MIPELKAEFKKVFTIRSTYIIFAIMIALSIFFGFYIGGWHSDKLELMDPLMIYKVAQQSIDFLAIFPALIGLLLFTHEFRYNTVTYSLTLSNNRSKVFAAKLIVVTILSLVSAAVILTISPLLADWGIHAHGLNMVHQSFYFKAIIWKGLAYGWAYAMAGFAIAALIRNQIGAIVVLFVVPGTVERLLSLLLKNNVVYLPFSSFHAMLGSGLEGTTVTITAIDALYVGLGYIIFSLAISWILFVRRDT